MLAISQKPGAGVEHLAELDADDPAERDGRELGTSTGRGPGRWSVAVMPLSSLCGSRWVSAVSSRNISSSPPLSALRSSVSTTPPSYAARPTSAVSASVRSDPSSETVVVTPAAASARWRATTSAARTTVPAACEELGLGALADDPALPDHHDVVGDDLDLGEQVGGQQDGPPVVGVVAEQVAHPADAGRVEPVGRLVQDQHRRVADQGGGDAEALAHAERVVAHPPVGLGLGEADQLEQLGDPGGRDAHDLLGDGQDLAAGAAGVLGGGVEHHADLAPGVGQVGEPAAGDGRRALGGRREADHHPHGRGLAGPVRAQEAGDPAVPGGEADVVDDGGAAVLLGQ